MGKITRSPGIERAFDNVFPVPVKSTRAPTSSDLKFPLGQVWVRTDTAQIYMLAQLASGSATWSLSSPGASDVDTLTGDSGGALSPAAGNITLAGGTNITSVGSGSTITFNLDAAITLATSVTSALYTTAAATDLLITAVTGQDIIMKMGDAGGVQKVSFTDSADAEVFAIDSNGGIGNLTSLTVVGAFTQTAGVVSISEDNSANAVGIANGTTARAITIGSSAAAHTITIGSATGAASLDLLAGTGNFTLEGGTATTYAISGTGANTGAITISGGTGAQTTNIATGATGVKTLNLATGAIGNVVTIGTVTAAASLDLLCGTGNFTLEGNVASTYDISATGANTGIITISGGTGAQTTNIATGATGVKTLNLATGAIGNIVTVGTVTAAASLDLLCGTGNFTLEGNVASTYAISGTGANTGAITISGGTGAQTTNIATGGTGVKTVNIGTGAIGNVVTVGTVTAAASLDLLCGTGNFTLEGNVASTYEISSTGVNTGTCKFASGTGARTVEIAGGGTGIKTVNIAAAATADVVVIGTTDGAGSTTIASGTGDITLSGTVKELNAEFMNATGDDITFEENPILMLSGNAPALPTGATGSVNLMGFSDLQMEQFTLGAGQTIIAPVMDATGLLVSGDLTATEGFEYNWGGARLNSRHAFTIGTSAAFFLEWKYTVADVSGAAPYMCGFRKVEANNATLTTYTDYALIGLDAVAAVATAVIKTELNAGGTTNTDTTDGWTDGQSHTMKILVSAAGVVTYLIDGIAPSVTAAFTFDNADVIVPFFRLEHQAGAPGTVHWETMKCGFQA